MCGSYDAALKLALRLFVKDTIHTRCAQDCVSAECVHSVRKLGAAPAMREPEQRLASHPFELSDCGLTTSFDSLMSTQSLVNSQTSKNKMSAAAARASASFADLISNLRTTSSPYLARTRDEGSSAGWGVFPVQITSFFGTLHTLLMIQSLNCADKGRRS